MREKSIKVSKAQGGVPWRLESAPRSTGTCLPRALTPSMASTSDHCWEGDAAQWIEYCYNGCLSVSPA